MNLARVFCLTLPLLLCGCGPLENKSSESPSATEAKIEEGFKAGEAIVAVRRDIPKAEIDAGFSVQEEVAAVRRDIYALADVAATDDLLVTDYPRSLAEVRADVEANKGGLWCWGAAYTLQLSLKEAGYETYTLSYGFPDEGLLTHAVTLVRIDGELYLQDPYLNLDYPIPFFQIVERLARGETPSARVDGGLRDVLVHDAGVGRSWAVPSGSDCKPSESRGGVMLCRAEANFTLFNERYMSTDGGPTLDLLEKYGHPRDVSFLLLYPFQVFDGSGTYKEEHPIIRRMQKIIAAQR
jgi:hypothetical protein